MALEYDIVICGAGPAGSTCALALAGSGLRVALIDKASFPRQKTCGDAVAAYVPKVLDSINPAFAKAANNFEQKTAVNTCRIVAPNGSFIDVRSPEWGFISPRYHWDNFLFNLASSQSNITAYTQHNIVRVSISSKEAVVVTDKETFNAKLVIGCDGAHSVTSKMLTQNKTDQQHYSASVRAYYKNISGFTPGTYELHFFEKILPGYFWIFPLPGNKANVGVCIPSKVVAKKKINLRSTMEDIIANHPAVKYRFMHAVRESDIEGFGLPLGMAKKTISGERFMLCGDAASLIDPTTGEGIGQSMISGRYAGWQALACFAQNHFSSDFMKNYDALLRKKLHRDFVKSYYTQWWVFNNKRLFNGIFSGLNAVPFLKKHLVKKIANT